MRRSFLIAATMLCFGGPATALDDPAVCKRLTQTTGGGLFLAYPNGAPALSRLGAQATCDNDGGFCFIKVGNRNMFDDTARFYFLPAPVPRKEEGVWHIRTQTRAMNLAGADQAYLARPAVTTRCHSDQPLEVSPTGPFVQINDYIDHHGGPGDNRPVLPLSRFFHFQIQEPVGGPNCIATDDRRAFGDLKSIYGFDDVARTPKLVSRLFSFVGPAAAAPTVYAGLSSEFAYQDSADPPCFGFSVPRITRTEYLNEKVDWKPSSTTVWIKRLRGKQVINVPEWTARAVSWSQQ